MGRGTRGETNTSLHPFTLLYNINLCASPTQITKRTKLWYAGSHLVYGIPPSCQLAVGVCCDDRS